MLLACVKVFFLLFSWVSDFFCIRWTWQIGKVKLFFCVTLQIIVLFFLLLFLGTVGKENLFGFEVGGVWVFVKRRVCACESISYYSPSLLTTLLRLSFAERCLSNKIVWWLDINILLCKLHYDFFCFAFLFAHFPFIAWFLFHFWWFLLLLESILYCCLLAREQKFPPCVFGASSSSSSRGHYNRHVCVCLCKTNSTGWHLNVCVVLRLCVFVYLFQCCNCCWVVLFFAILLAASVHFYCPVATLISRIVPGRFICLQLEQD